MSDMEGIKEAYAFLATSKVRTAVVKALRKGMLRPTEIAKKTNQKQANVSRVLAQLEKKGLVKCLTPEKKAWRVYSLTELGEQIFKKEI